MFSDCDFLQALQDIQTAAAAIPLHRIGRIATICNSRSTNCGITMTPSRNPVSAISEMRPS